jgi:SH3-like domain-containing protein
VRYLAEPGVVGRIESCSGGWCELDVAGRQGFIRAAHIWGVGPDEEID